MNNLTAFKKLTLNFVFGQILRKLFRLIVDGRGISATVDGLMKYILELTFIE